MKNVGLKDDIVTVKNGYAANYLIPQGMAIAATASAKKVHAENLRQRAHKEAKFRSDAEALAAKLSSVVVKLSAKVSESGKLFGSVGAVQIADALVALGHEVNHKDIEIVDNDTIKALGEYKAVVKCYRDIKATVNVVVEGTEE